MEKKLSDLTVEDISQYALGFAVACGLWNWVMPTVWWYVGFVVWAIAHMVGVDYFFI